ELLTRIAEECAPEGFDIIIDDGSHIGEITRQSYRHLFHHHLKPGGVYIIEDWGIGYSETWPDGKAFVEPSVPPLKEKTRNLETDEYIEEEKEYPGVQQFESHHYGLPGFIKQLVDELAHLSINATRPPDQQLPVTIERMELFPGQAFIWKLPY
ncbi:MAG: hypothetical protein R3330_08015, partial [Saprospiraceae bacterium]|nr:hypothetical protein [Saprospiraceae bacterium]